MLISALEQLLSFLGTEFCFLSSLFLSPCNCLIQISLPYSLPLCLPGPGVQQRLGAVAAPKAGLERSVLWPWGEIHSQGQVILSPQSQQ